MKNIKIRCPCCDNEIVVKTNGAEIYSVFFNAQKISSEEAFAHFDICVGEKGGDNVG